jgi:CheY-like chemotaxis protein
LPELPLILIAEDDEAIQAIIEQALNEGGFEVEIVARGEEAMTALLGDKSKYRALVIDINLRGRTDGWTVAKQAREIDPAFPIVYTTAGSGEWRSRGVPNSILLTSPTRPRSSSRRFPPCPPTRGCRQPHQLDPVRGSAAV